MLCTFPPPWQLGEGSSIEGGGGFHRGSSHPPCRTALRLSSCQKSIQINSELETETLGLLHSVRENSSSCVLNLNDLYAVVKETLESRGCLAQIKARIRAEVYNALDDQSEPRPKLSNENVLINELIREYLDFNNYKYSASVLQAGTGCTFRPRRFQALLHWPRIAILPELSGRIAIELCGNVSTQLGTNSNSSLV